MENALFVMESEIVYAQINPESPIFVGLCSKVMHATSCLGTSHHHITIDNQVLKWPIYSHQINENVSFKPFDLFGYYHFDPS